MDPFSISKFYECEFVGCNRAGAYATNCAALFERCEFHCCSFDGLQLFGKDLDAKDYLEKESSGSQIFVISECTIRNNLSGVDGGEGALIWMRNNKIYENREYGVQLRNANAILEGNKVRDNNIGLIVWVESKEEEGRMANAIKQKNQAEDNKLKNSVKMIPNHEKGKDFIIQMALNEEICTAVYTSEPLFSFRISPSNFFFSFNFSFA